jgi:PKD repeat protein
MKTHGWSGLRLCVRRLLAPVVIASTAAVGLTVGGAQAKPPTPPPPITAPPATGDTQPPVDAIVAWHQPGGCGGWQLTSSFGGRWTADSTWWQYECWRTGMSDETTPDWVDYYYWDGARGVYYGEWWTEPYEAWDPFCSYWRDVATGQSYGPYACIAETNDYPIASLTVACSGLSCSFDATGSTDSDGTIQEFYWYFGDGTDGSGATTEHTYAAGGTYAVQLVVADDGGLTGYASEQVTVSVGAAPIAAFTVNCTAALCNFDASGSSDDDGTIRTYSWSFGDGTWTSGSTPTATHTYGLAGTYSARLAVTDDSGNIAVADRDVAVATGNR